MFGQSGFGDASFGGSSSIAAAAPVSTLVSADILATYSIAALVSADLAAAFSVATLVSADLSATFAVEAGMLYARAPAGDGYIPQRREMTMRPAAIQRNAR